MVLSACDMPNKRSFWQVHKEIQVVAQLLEEPLLQVALQISTTKEREHLCYLRCRIATFHHLCFDARCQTCFTRIGSQWYHTVIIFIQQSTYDICYQLKSKCLCTLRGEYTCIFELPPYFHGVHIVLYAEFFPLFVILIERVEVSNVW